jgi:Holliday junction resolvase RusA-like endonuclease
MKIAFTVYGEPVAQPRTKHFANKYTGRVVTVSNRRDHPIVLWKARLIEAVTANRPEVPIAGPVFLTVRFYRGIPTSWSKKKQAAAALGTVWPTGKPDLDNLVKAVKDCCNSIIWHDDSLVVKEVVSKLYSNSPRVEIEIEEAQP